MKPTIRDIDTVTRSIISAWLIDQVRVRALLLQKALLVAAAICVPLIFLFNGPWKLLPILGAIGFAFFGFGGMVVRWLAVFGIKRFAAPKHFDAYRSEIDRVIVDADLPTTPLSALRFMVRLRRGVKPEVARLHALGVRVTEIIAMKPDGAMPPPPGTPHPAPPA